MFCILKELSQNRPIITAPCNSMQTLKFNIQPTIAFFTAVNQRTSKKTMLGSVMSKGHVQMLWLVDLDRLFWFLFFSFNQLVVAIVMIDSSKTHKLLVRFCSSEFMLLKGTVISLKIKDWLSCFVLFFFFHAFKFTTAFYLAWNTLREFSTKYYYYYYYK